MTFSALSKRPPGNQLPVGLLGVVLADLEGDAASACWDKLGPTARPRYDRPMRCALLAAGRRIGSALQSRCQTQRTTVG